MSKLSNFFSPLRIVLGDRETVHNYEDESLRKALQTVVAMGKLPGYTLTNNRFDISPDIPEDGTGDPNKYALLLYHTARLLVSPDQSAYSYRTRALAETFGSQREFMADLEIAISDLEGGVHFRTWQSFAGWFAGVTGVNLWDVYADLKTSGVPFKTVTLGANGTTVS